MTLYRRAASRLLQIVCGWRVRRIPGVEADPTATFVGMPIIEAVPGAKIVLGARVVLISRPDATALGVAHPVVLRALERGAIIEIGADTGISGGSYCAATAIRIGERCLMGADVTVADTDFHPVDVVPRRYVKPGPESSRAVSIGDDVFVGTKAVVLKGSTIGDGAVVGASSVVAGTVVPRTIVAGNPARPVRELRNAL